MNELLSKTTIAGLPTTKANPIFSKDIFKIFVPKFSEYIDRLDGQVETIKNEVTVGTVITNTPTKIGFNNTFINESGNKTVLTIDSNNDVIIGKKTTICYREGYNTLSEVTLTDTSGLDNVITISYYLKGELIKTIVFNLDPNEEIVEEIDFNFGNGNLLSLLTIEISDENNSSEITLFKETVKSNFAAAWGDGAILYEAFCGISNQKIVQTIWNTEWEYAMSLCIAHYLAIAIRESEVSYGLGDIAGDSGPRGSVVTDKEKNKYDYKNITLSRNAAKFWQTTEYGRLLITLLDTKTVVTMITVN